MGTTPVRDDGRQSWTIALRCAAYQIAGVADPVCRGWKLPVAAISVGACPPVVSFWFGLPGHQLVSAVLLALLCLALARQDRWLTGIAVIAGTFVVHNVVVMALARANPEVAAEVLPDAAAYWQKQITWIRTGRDPEYALSAWVPAHVQLLAGVVIFSFTSWGVIPFAQGFYEVDLMNYYNARLAATSLNEPLAIATGWHIWSALRGVGYLFITFEVISLSLELVSGRTISTTGRRRKRWALGLGFLLTDGLIKATILEATRLQLLSNLK